MESISLKSYSRRLSFLLVIAVYILAFFAAFAVYGFLDEIKPLTAMFFADAAATVVVWLCGVLFNNSSLYDPYWSVAPIVIIPVWFLQKGISLTITLPGVLLLLVVFIWGIRLTLNWAVVWRGISHQDWRYTMYREKMPQFWFFVNFFGINMMPTVLVFLAMIPAYFAIANVQKMTWLMGIGFVLCIASAVTQHIADRQMRAFRSLVSAEGQCIDEGLWRFSRHPNYLGEIGFWWGIWLIQQGGIVNRGDFFLEKYSVAGPVLITLLFVFISIPMMEAHILESRSNYAQYKKNVSMLIPFVRWKQ